MPQTVPSGGWSPPSDLTCLFAADSFDLSLLPPPASPEPSSQPAAYPTNLPGAPGTNDRTDYFVLSLYEPAPTDHGRPVKQEPVSSAIYQCPSYSPPPLLDDYLQVKQESPGLVSQSHPQEEARCLQELYFFGGDEEQTRKSDASEDQGSPVKCLQSPEPNRILYQEDTTKKKDTIIRSLLEGDSRRPVNGGGGNGGGDHKLLREVLRDTSFQRRYNLIPFNVGELGTGFRGMEEQQAKSQEGQQPQQPQEEVIDLEAAQEGIEPMLSLAIEQLKKEVHATCTILGISTDPSKWSAEEVGTWLAWNSAQHNIPLGVLQYFNMPGSQLVTLTEQDFQQRAPECGSLLHAQLEIWKAARVEETTVDVTSLLQETTTQSSSSCGEPSEDEDDEQMEVSAGGPGGTGSSATGPGSSPSPKSSSCRGSSSSSSSGSHIHLWQFLKELLGLPQLYGSCIRWVDRPNGVFKIEDSVRVARLWGMRKNRPAMNYDKLSRSIRQYYKKGIMKKTERSQRLVYQFCHPYSL